MFKGFKDFILRGNVMDLAVAVVIGAAFTAVVNALVEKVFNPLLGALFKADSLDQAFIVTIPLPTGEAQLLFGAFIGAVIQFLLVALVVYFCLILPMNKLKTVSFGKKGAEPEETAAELTELELLSEIRDLLAKESGSTPKH